MEQENDEPDDKASVTDRLNERDHRKVDNDLLVDLEHRVIGIKVISDGLIALPRIEVVGVGGNGNAENGRDGIGAEQTEKPHKVKGNTEREFACYYGRHFNIGFNVLHVIRERKIGNTGNIADDDLIGKRSG